MNWACVGYKEASELNRAKRGYGESGKDTRMGGPKPMWEKSLGSVLRTQRTTKGIQAGRKESRLQPSSAISSLNDCGQVN